MTTTNADIIRRQIAQKINSNGPYFPPDMEIFRVVTDVNEQPYTRFFRGKPWSYRPFVWDREAGYSSIRATTTKPEATSAGETSGPPCFQIPCSTVLPCKTGNVLAPSDACVFSSP